MAIAFYLAILSFSQTFINAAIVLSVSWLFSLCWFLAIGDAQMSWGYAIADLGCAVAFWRMSVTRWFPVPLFLIHALRIVLHLLAVIFGLSTWWIVALGNRLHDLVLVYFITCALIVIRHRRKRTAVNNERRSANGSANG